MLTLAIFASGCSFNQAPEQNQNTLTFLIPTQDYLKYCNGADMDSDGFRKTITQKETVTISETNLSSEQLANKMLTLAAQQASLTFPQSNENPLNYIKIKDQTAYIEPTEGWAGVSIFLCFWKPFVEVNLLQFPGIKNVIWTTDQAQWQGLK